MTSAISTPRTFAAELKRLRRDTDSDRISSSGSGAVQGLAADSASNSASAAPAQPSAELARKTICRCSRLRRLLAAAFAAYHFWPRSNAPSRPRKDYANQPVEQADEQRDAFSRRPRCGVCLTGCAASTQVFLMLTSGGEPLQLTNDEGEKSVDKFSSDGKEVYYQRIPGLEGWAVPTLGGSPRRVANARGVVPSPDEPFIYYGKFGGAGIFRAEKSGLNEELVYNPEGSWPAIHPAFAIPRRR